jgi:hypothetical protein
MCCLIMVIRPDTLPTDPTALAGMVLARRRERAVAPVVQTLKDMIIGAWSERFIAVADEQLALELNDVCKMLGRPILPAHCMHPTVRLDLRLRTRGSTFTHRHSLDRLFALFSSRSSGSEMPRMDLTPPENRIIIPSQFVAQKTTENRYSYEKSYAVNDELPYPLKFPA